VTEQKFLFLEILKMKFTSKSVLTVFLFGCLLSPQGVRGEGPEKWSPVKPYPSQAVYYPGTEALQPNEMRVIACGTGMPQPRLKQAGSCFLVELGNGDKFIFDMGKGSTERLAALGIPTDQLNKVLISHLHFDHAGDFPSFWLARGVNAARQPLYLWGPGGGQNPDWGIRGWSEKIEKAWAWDGATRKSSGDPRSTQLHVTEIDWKQVNHLFYDENGVKIYSIPTIHVDQSVGYILEWNGLKFAYSGDTAPNKWFLEHAQGADLAIHETMLPPDLWVEKYSMSHKAAVMSGTQGHTTPAAFGKVMEITMPRMAVASHFQNDFDTAPLIKKAIRRHYQGPLSLAMDFMVWNITKDTLTTRMAVANPESYPPPAQVPALPPAPDENAYQFDPFSFTGLEKRTSAVTNEVVREFNAKYGTNIEPVLSRIPFRD
jgi:ribonuclease Z